eukprot:c5090_g1_i1 orf=257-463(+)
MRSCPLLLTSSAHLLRNLFELSRTYECVMIATPPPNLFARLLDVKLLLRDANRFHHFKNALCSCGDYW